MRDLILVVAFLFGFTAFSQELNCEVVVNAQMTGNENVQVFKTLERQLKEFVNNTQWTNKSFKPQERINCSMVINVQDYNNDSFQATIQIQSSRPTFNSSYSTPVYNFNDRDFTFQYLEFQNLVYNPNQYESNLVSVLTYHIYMILGLDADTFSQNGGDEYFRQVQNITNYSQQSNFKGWKLEDGLQSRFAMIDNLMSPTFKEFRTVMYNYHLNGLDTMADNPKKAKEALTGIFPMLREMNNKRPNSFLLRVFFDAKADEIEQIFSDGPSVNVTETIEILNRIAPTHASKWRNINF
uniref:type IX secretion system protein PorD n=1 Tax=Gelidibacter sp. TaxID=2018083 RepID=UPI00404B753F